LRWAERPTRTKSIGEATAGVLAPGASPARSASSRRPCTPRVWATTSSDDELSLKTSDPPRSNHSTTVRVSAPSNMPEKTDPTAERIKRSEEHTSELQSPYEIVCRLLLEKKK